MAVTLKEKAYQALRLSIIQGNMRSGEFLTERELVEQLGMSRTPIRAALERLEAEGLVTYTPNRGIYVTEMTINKVVDFFDYRMAIESYVVGKLASRVMESSTAQWFEDNLARQLACMETNDIAQFSTEDSEFHSMLSTTYGNKEIMQTMARLQDKLYQNGLNVLRKDSGRIRSSYEDHLNIYKLIREGQGKEASEQMIQHLEYGKSILLY